MHSIAGEDSRLLSRRQVAKKLNVHYESVGRWERAGKLPAIKLGPRCTRYREEDVESFLEAGYVQRGRK